MNEKSFLQCIMFQIRSSTAIGKREQASCLTEKQSIYEENCPTCDDNNENKIPLIMVCFF